MFDTSCRNETEGNLFHLSDTRPVRTASLSVFGESVTRCRETVASRTRGLTVLLRDLAALIHRDTVTGIQEVQFQTTLFHKTNESFSIFQIFFKFCLYKFQTHFPFLMEFQLLCARPQYTIHAN
jgi:hypothetical protein